MDSLGCFGIRNSDKFILHFNQVCFQIYGMDVFGFGHPKSHFFAPEKAIFSDFGCKKMGLRMPKSKNGDHFLSPTIPKNGGIDSCFTRISFSGEFWANFENRVF